MTQAINSVFIPICRDIYNSMGSQLFLQMDFRLTAKINIDLRLSISDLVGILIEVELSRRWGWTTTFR